MNRSEAPPSREVIPRLPLDIAETAMRLLGGAASTGDSGELDHRIEVNDRFRRRFGRDAWLLGASDNLIRLSEFLHQASGVDLPVLLIGPPGCGRGDAVRWLHLLGERHSGPFVTVDGTVVSEEWLGHGFTEALARAQGGTLYFSALDETSRELQSRLAQMLNTGVDPWGRAIGARTSEVRMVASALPPNGGAAGTRLHPALRDELAFLSFEIAPLAARPADVEALALYFLRSYGRDLDALPDGLVQALRSYTWPGNVPELRRAMARLATSATPFDQVLPDLFSQSFASSEAPPVEIAASGRPSLARLILGCACGSLPRNAGSLHTALTRAVAHVATASAADPLSLRDLARAGCVSPFYLSHLFKNQLGISPIAFVLRVRVERAKGLLVTHPELSISQIALNIGFGDLRHFERIFKRVVGVTPRSFRAQRSGGS
jgi:AraC-like DNA-binding protein